jgi:hypothetical protein
MYSEAIAESEASHAREEVIWGSDGRTRAVAGKKFILTPGCSVDNDSTGD